MGAKPGQAKIARIWRGRVARARADEYEIYNYQAGVEPLVKLAVGVMTLREDCETWSEFVTISYWASLEDMRRFTGGDPTNIHHLPRDPEFLLDLPKEVQILDIRHLHGSLPSAVGLGLRRAPL
jgi:hypothetical protein